MPAWLTAVLTILGIARDIYVKSYEKVCDVCLPARREVSKKEAEAEPLGYESGQQVEFQFDDDDDDPNRNIA